MTDSAATTASLPRFALGEGTTAFEAAVDQARSEDWATRLFDRDTTLWSTDPRVQEAIAQRLGWLDAPEEFANRTASLEGPKRALFAILNKTGRATMPRPFYFARPLPTPRTTCGPPPCPRRRPAPIPRIPLDVTAAGSHSRSRERLNCRVSGAPHTPSGAHTRYATSSAHSSMHPSAPANRPPRDRLRSDRPAPDRASLMRSTPSPSP